MPRRRAACFMSFAKRGKCSLIRMPGMEVSMGRNSPRISAGASGLGSNVSMWLGPPAIQRRMQDLGRGPPGAAAARRLSQPLSVTLAAEAAAAVARNFRRAGLGCIAALLYSSVVHRELAGHQKDPRELAQRLLRRRGGLEV